jgi:thioredoxin-dependent peroxiredoxin
MTDEKKIKLEIDDIAPDFTAENQAGETIHLYSELENNKNVLLVFYPKDFTPGCTTQLCDIRDVFAEYKKHGVTVLGINPAESAKHAEFIKEYSFPFDILVDKDREIIDKYGAKGFLYGRPRIMRGVFLIGPNKRIIYRFWGQQDNQKILQILANQ